MNTLLVFLSFFALISSHTLAATRAPREQKTHNVSWAPNLGYSSTYGFLFGLGYFRKPISPPGTDLSTTVIATTSANAMLISELRYLTEGPWQYYLNFRVSNFFTLYYGEGDETTLGAEREIENYVFNVRIGPEYFFTPQWSTSLYADFRARREKFSLPTLPEETSSAVGTFIKYNDFNAAAPALFSQQHKLTVRLLPPFLTDQLRSTLVQAELDLRAYVYLEKNLGFATRLFLGHSFSTPTYLFTYHLGGHEFLRGFKSNRFRNRDMISIQEEFRFPIYNWLSGALFTDIADVGDAKFEHFKFTYGPGLRIGLPPDYIQKLRLDVGFSYDGVGVLFLFGDTF